MTLSQTMQQKLDQYMEYLCAHPDGYTPNTIRTMVNDARRFACWLDASSSKKEIDSGANHESPIR